MDKRASARYPVRPSLKVTNHWLSSMRKRGGVWLAALLAGLAAAPAQPTNTPTTTLSNSPLQRLSLADAQRLAFEKNWDLLAAAAGVEAATAQKIVARQFPNPTLSHTTPYQC